MKFIDDKLEALAFDLIIKLTTIQEKRNKLLLNYCAPFTPEEKDELAKLNNEINWTLEQLKLVYQL